MYASGAAGLIATVLFVLLLTRGITGPIHTLIGQATQVAAGNLAALPTVTRKDEVGELSAAFAQMIRSLREALQFMQAAGDELVASGGVLSASASGRREAASAIVARLHDVVRDWELQAGRFAAAGSDIHQLQAAIAQVAAGAEKQVQSVASAAERISLVTAGVREVALSAEAVATTAAAAWRR